MPFIRDLINRGIEKDELKSSIPLMVQALSQYRQDGDTQDETPKEGSQAGDNTEDGPDYSGAAKSTKAYRDILNYDHGLDKDQLSTMSLGELRGVKDALSFKTEMATRQENILRMKAQLENYNAQREVRKQQAFDMTQGSKMIQRYGDLLADQGQDPEADVAGEADGKPKLNPEAALAQTMKEYGTVGRYSDNALGMLLKYHGVMSGKDGGDQIKYMEDPITGVRKAVYGKQMQESGINPEKIKGMTVEDGDGNPVSLAPNGRGGFTVVKKNGGADPSLVVSRQQRALADWHKRLDPVQANIEQLSSGMEDPKLKPEDKTRKQKTLKTLMDQRDDILSERPKFNADTTDKADDEAETEKPDVSKMKFTTPVAVRAAVTSGKMTKQQGAKVLRDQFGYN